MSKYNMTLVLGVALAFCLLLAVQLLPAAELSDAQARRFFNQRACNACHEVHETRIGPSFQNIARRYSDASPATIERLVLKVRAGGAGAWGIVPMISYPQLSYNETQGIVRWILQRSTSDDGKP